MASSASPSSALPLSSMSSSPLSPLSMAAHRNTNNNDPIDLTFRMSSSSLLASLSSSSSSSSSSSPSSFVSSSSSSSSSSSPSSSSPSSLSALSSSSSSSVSLPQLSSGIISSHEQQSFINEVQNYSFKLYQGTDENDRKIASEYLYRLSSGPQGFIQCKLILEHSTLTEAKLVAATSLLKCVSEYWNSIAGVSSVELSNYLISYLFRHAEVLPPFIITPLTQCVARCSKLGWLVHEDHSRVVQTLIPFLDVSSVPVGRCQLIVLSILSELINDMNHIRTRQSYSEHRKIARAFRDSVLLPIFNACINTLSDIHSGRFNTAGVSRDAVDAIAGKALSSCIACVTFDFIGLSADGDDSETVLQLPASWRSTIENGNHVRLIVEMIPRLSAERSVKCVELLVEMAFIRRSLFSSDIARQTHLDNLLTASLTLLQQYQSLLAHSDFYHATTTLLSAIVHNYPLSEIANAKSSSNWFKAIIAFTSESFASLNSVSSGSLLYVLQTWSRVASQLPSLSADTFPGDLQGIIPQIAMSFIQGRLEHLSHVVILGTDEIDEAFDASALEAQVKHLPSLIRYNYATSAGYLTQRIDPLVDQYKSILDSLSTGAPSSNNINGVGTPMSMSVGSDETSATMCVVQSSLAYLLSVLGVCIISDRVPSLSDATEMETVDAQLSAYFFQIMNLVNAAQGFTSHDNRVTASTRVLVLAALDFLQAFYRRYLQFPSGQSWREDRAENTIWCRLSQWLGATTQVSLLSAIVTLLMFNLSHRHDELIVRNSLQILESLASGYTTGPILANDIAIQQLTITHKPGELLFGTLGVSVGGRLQQKLYLALATLVFRATITKNYMDAFLEPFDILFNTLKNQANLRSEAVSNVTMSVCRSLQGVFSASHSTLSYRHLFEWLKPYFPILLRLIETWWDEPLVVSTALKFFSELVYNKSQRIRFVDNSANGIVLFREVTKMIEIFSSRMQTFKYDDADSDVYKKKIKSLCQILKITVRALVGNFANFGIMAFYHDTSLQKVLKSIFPLIVSIQLEDLLSYSKAAYQYFCLLQVLFENHVGQVVVFDTKVFLGLLSSLYEGLHQLDIQNVHMAANAIDALFVWYYDSNKNRVKNDVELANQVQLLRQHLSSPNASALIIDIFCTLANNYLFEYVEHNFTLPKPMCSILVAFPEALAAYEQRLLLSQPPDLHARIVAALNHIMDGLDKHTLDNSMREKFASNLAETRLEISSFAIKPF